MRTYKLTRSRELGAEWTGEDVAAGFTMTVALDIDRESFMWAVVFTPPAKFRQPWNEPMGDAGETYAHEAVRPLKRHGKELTFEDAKEEAEAALEELKPLVKGLHLDDLVGPGKAPAKAKRR